MANKKIIPVGNTTIGKQLTLIAGPCTVESEEQICEIARAVKNSGATILRGGAYKPRTNVHSFQGLHEVGIKMLLTAKQETGMPIVTEITDISELSVMKDVDMLQVGARNMQNFELLRALGRQDKPILLKRGFAATYDELLSAAGYIRNEGNENIVLCERGIRTFEQYTRYTLDISAVPALSQMTDLPVIVDPSHAAGRYDMIESLCYAGVAAGADGLIVEVHNNPACAVCDGRQSLKPALFDRIAQNCIRISGLLEGCYYNEKADTATPLKELRKNIDEIDEELSALFKKRLDCVKEIGQYKREHNIPVTDSKRENEILATLDEPCRKLYRKIFEISKENE